jgi:hypothetical protein
MDSTFFRYLISLAVQMALEIRLLDVITAYLYGDIDVEIHIKPLPDFLPNTTSAQHGHFSGLKMAPPGRITTARPSQKLKFRLPAIVTMSQICYGSFRVLNSKCVWSCKTV